MNNIENVMYIKLCAFVRMRDILGGGHVLLSSAVVWMRKQTRPPTIDLREIDSAINVFAIVWRDGY